MKARNIIIIGLSCLVIVACLASPFAVSQFQNVSALSYSEENTISPISISKKTLTNAQKFKLYADSTNDTSAVTVTSVGRESALLDSDTIEQAFYEQMEKIDKINGLNMIYEKNSSDYKLCNPEIFAYSSDPSSYAIFWIVSLETKNYTYSFVMDDETKMLYNLSIYSNNSKALFDKNTENLADRFGKGICEYIGADKINYIEPYNDTEFIVNYAFDDNSEIDCYVTLSVDFTELSVLFTDSIYSEKSDIEFDS